MPSSLKGTTSHISAAGRKEHNSSHHINTFTLKYVTFHFLFTTWGEFKMAENKTAAHSVAYWFGLCFQLSLRQPVAVTLLLIYPSHPDTCTLYYWYQYLLTISLKEWETSLKTAKQKLGLFAFASCAVELVAADCDVINWLQRDWTEVVLGEYRLDNNFPVSKHTCITKTITENRNFGGIIRQLLWWESVGRQIKLSSTMGNKCIMSLDYHRIEEITFCRFSITAAISV